MQVAFITPRGNASEIIPRVKLAPSNPDHTLAIVGLIASVWFGLPALMLFFVSPVGGAVLAGIALASLLGSILRFATTPTAE